MPETGGVREAHRTLAGDGACHRLSGVVQHIRQVLGLVSGLAPLLYPGREDPHLPPPRLSATGTYPNDGVELPETLARLGPNYRIASSAVKPILGLADRSTKLVLSHQPRVLLGVRGARAPVEPVQAPGAHLFFEDRQRTPDWWTMEPRVIHNLLHTVDKS